MLSMINDSIELINDIDDYNLEFEYCITRNLLDYYEKMLYMEFYLRTSVSTSSVILESDVPENDSSKKQGFLSKIWNGIKKIIDIIINSIKKVITNIKKHFSKVERVNRVLKSASKEDLSEIEQLFKKYGNENTSSGDDSQGQDVTTESATTLLTTAKNIGKAYSKMNSAKTIPGKISAATNVFGPQIANELAKKATTSTVATAAAAAGGHAITTSVTAALTTFAGASVAASTTGLLATINAPTLIATSIISLAISGTNKFINSTEKGKEKYRKEHTNLPTMDQILYTGAFLSKNMNSINTQVASLSTSSTLRTGSITSLISADVKRTLNDIEKIKNYAWKSTNANEPVVLETMRRVSLFHERILKLREQGSRIKERSKGTDNLVSSFDTFEDAAIFTDSYTVFSSIQGNELNNMLQDLDNKMEEFKLSFENNPIFQNLYNMAGDEYTDTTEMGIIKTRDAKKQDAINKKQNDQYLKESDRKFEITIKNDLVPIRAFVDAVAKYIFGVKEAYDVTLEVCQALAITSRKVLRFINNNSALADVANENKRVNRSRENVFSKLGNQYLTGKGSTKYSRDDGRYNDENHQKYTSDNLTTALDNGNTVIPQ